MDQVSITAAQDERREWRLLWLGSIQAFADSFTQTKPGFSFADCMSGYFDEAYLRDTDAYQRRLAAAQVTPAEIAAVADFHALAECYESPNNDDRDTRAILNDPKWQAVVGAARNAQERLLPLLIDPSEREALTRPLYGREQANTLQVDHAGSPVITDRPSLAKTMRDLCRGSLILTKPVSPTTANIPSDVRRRLVPLGFRADKDASGVTYRIGYFALGRGGSSDPTSMFAAFNEITLGQQSGNWMLRLKLNPMMWLVFPIMIPAVLFRHSIATIGASDIGIALAVPTAMLAGAVLWAVIRVSRWWSRL